jgi:glutamate synthase (NADPH/NADH) small chain
MEIDRKTGDKMPVAERITHYKEIQLPLASQEIEKQASRCMDCGVPFCNNACPLGNSLPDLNDLVRHGNWEKALQILQATNNFPEFTGRLCPALCEASCNLSIHQKAVITKEIELSIVEKGFENGWVIPQAPVNKTGYKVAVVGSGPAGLAAAQQLIRAGHKVTVYERSAEIGGILALGIPDYKLEKTILKRRIDQLTAEGIHFVTGVSVGAGISIAALKEKYDAICLCCGSTVPRNLNVDGRHLRGIHFAMDFLTQQNLINAGQAIQPKDLISAKGKHVVIIGGGDTGADCSGVSIRQGAVKVTQLELMPMPPLARTSDMPWPEWPMTLTTNTAHEEGGEREWGVTTKYFIGEGDQVKEIVCSKVVWEKTDEGSRMMEVEGGTFTLKADLVLFAMGFLHPEHGDVVDQLSLKLSDRGNVETNSYYMTSQEGVFAAGDMRMGQSLVCKAIADGRKAAEKVNRFLIKGKGL